MYEVAEQDSRDYSRWYYYSSRYGSLDSDPCNIIEDLLGEASITDESSNNIVFISVGVVPWAIGVGVAEEVVATVAVVIVVAMVTITMVAVAVALVAIAMAIVALVAVVMIAIVIVTVTVVARPIVTVAWLTISMTIAWLVVVPV